MGEVVAELERRFLSRLAEAGREIEQDFPPVGARAWSTSFGSLTAAQGHTVGLECWFPDAPADRPDNLALEISVWHLTTTPELYQACVVWNSPSGAGEIDLIEAPIPYSPAALAALADQFGELVAAIRRGVARGEPPGWRSAG